METKNLTINQRMAIKGVKWAEKIAVKRAKKDMVNMSEKHREFIDELQEKCADLMELVPVEKQGIMCATICSNLIQGFDTKKEMDMVIKMIQSAVDEYWKMDDIPQKGL